MSVPDASRERALADVCELLGAGCEERPARRPGWTDLRFWVPAPAGPDDAERVRAALSGAGIEGEVTSRDEGDAWRDAMRAFHRPVEVAGTLVVRPPWTDPRPGLLDVVIDPGMAFGTAQHGTTRACLAMLCALVPQGAVLDAGSGSGVLAIAARRLGFSPVTAIDSDPLAVEATLANARRNGVALTVARRTVGTDPVPCADIVLANLTLSVLRILAAHLPSPSPSHMILSGLRADEADLASGLFAGRGLVEVERVHDGGWTTVRMERGS